jgi:hypothetical protein
MSQQKGVVGGGHLGEQLYRELALGSIVLNAGTVAGADIDGLGKGTMIFSINLGAFTGTPTFDAKIQESDEGGGAGYTDAAATGMFTGAGVAIAQQTVGDQIIEIIVDTAKLKRYKRISITVAGGTPVCPTSVTCISHPTERVPAA